MKFQIFIMKQLLILNVLQNTNNFCNFMQEPFSKEQVKDLIGKIVIPFNLYFADWEPDNELGSHRKMSAVAATYVTFPTIPRKVLWKIFW